MMNAAKRSLWILLIILLCWSLSACKVIYTTPPPESDLANEIFPEAKAVTTLAGSNWYYVQQQAPSYIANLSALGCNWQGVAGQVFDVTGAPVMNLTVKVGGTINGQNFSSDGVTGTSTAYGPGGYEVDLAGSPVASTGTLWIQLFDANGNPKSDKFFFNTYQDCAKNLLVINFNDPGAIQARFPLIYR